MGGGSVIMPDFYENIKQRNYSIVVVGAMNPAIHHPSWYEAVGLLNSGEVKQATSSGETVTVPHLSKYQIDKFQIQCTLDSWQIITKNVKELGRIKEIASGTFKRLNETPVSSYGLNSRFVIGYNFANAINALGNLFSKQPFNFASDTLSPEFDTLSLSYVLQSINIPEQPRVNRKLRMTLNRLQKNPNNLVLDFNCHHVIETTELHFDLSILIESSLEMHKYEEKMAHDIFLTLSSMTE